MGSLGMTVSRRTEMTRPAADHSMAALQTPTPSARLPPSLSDEHMAHAALLRHVNGGALTHARDFRRMHLDAETTDHCDWYDKLRALCRKKVCLSVQPT